MGHANWVDRGEIEDREPHCGDGREPPLRELEGAASGRHRPLRSREHLVPRREAGDLAFDPELIRAGDRGVTEIGRSSHQPHRCLTGRQLDPRLGWRGRIELRCERGQGAAVGLGDGRQLGSGGSEGRAICEIELHIDACLEADRQVASETAPDVEDAHHREAPGAEAPGLDPGPEAVLGFGLHGHLDHGGRWRIRRERPGSGPVPDPGEQGIMPVREGARRDPQRQSASGFCGERTAVDTRPDVLDNHSPPIAEQPVRDGVAHRIHLRREVGHKLADGDRSRNGSST